MRLRGDISPPAYTLRRPAGDGAFRRICLKLKTDGEQGGSRFLRAGFAVNLIMAQ